MKGKVVIITGGSSGMGKEIARKLVEEGANVLITGRTIDKLEAARKDLAIYEGKVECFQMDVRNVDDVNEMVKEAKVHFSRIDALVNNAAGNFTSPAEEISPNGWNAVVNIVLNGTWYCTQAVAKDWIANGVKGNVLNMVASTAWTGGAGVAHSASAKAGVLALTRTLAVEWGYRYGIRVNAMAPGPIQKTGGSERLFSSEEAYKHTIESVPINRFGEIDEIAELAYFMLSSKANYMNGECITLDGGQWLNRKPFIERLDDVMKNK